MAIDEVNQEESETLANRIADPSGRKQPSCHDEAGSRLFHGPQPSFPCHWMLQGVCQGDQHG